MAYIYSITNKTNNKKYIGKTIDLKHRWNNHIYDLSNNKHHSCKLQNAWLKYGQNNFQFDIVEEVDEINLNDREKYWIQYYDTYLNGYNETFGGDGCGHEVLQKTVYCYDFNGNYLNLSFRSGREAARELGIDQTLIFNICNNTRNKKSATSKVDGQIYRFSYVLQDKLSTIVYNRGQKSILQLDLNNNVIKEWPSIAEASEVIGGNRRSTSIIKALKDSNRTAFGYKWTYRDLV